MNELPVAEWLQQYFNGSISPEQKELLANWVQEHGHTEEFEILLAQSWKNFQPNESVPKEQADEWLNNILKPVVPIKRKMPWKWMAAAATVLLAISIWYLWPKNITTRPITPIVQTDIPAPKASTAVLTLSNGKQIVLDSAATGQLALQGATGIVKLDDGQIAYQGTTNAGELQYNTLTVPAGSRITSIRLSDGTSVTLNAASSITYPVAFNSTARKVRISGEVYFEVSKSKTPFIVDVNGKTDVEVLGTHFNINAYDDEEAVKTTLLEGSVKVGGKITLKPGEQTDGLQTTTPDLPSIVAWKNNLFLYKGANIQTIMRDVARTYNVSINYESTPTEQFYAEVPRNTNISNLLKIMELTGEVHFKVQDRQVTVIK